MSRSAPVNVAVLGYGYWGPHLVRNLLAVPGVRVVTIADIDPRRTAAVGAPVKTTTDWPRVIEDREVDAVVIATPAATHPELVRAALMAGKHVLVEKPLAGSRAEAEELARLVDREGLVLMVGHTFLYSEPVRRLREYVSDGRLGSIFHVHAERLSLGRVRSDVNALWNFGPHDISILLYLLGETPVRVEARGFGHLRREIHDVVYVDMTFPGGTSAHVHVSWLHPTKVRRMTLIGSEKMAVYDDVSADAKLTLFDRGIDRVPTADAPRDFSSFLEFSLLKREGDVMIPAIRMREPLLVECEHFVQCIRDGGRPLTDAWHGVNVVGVLEAAQRSLDERVACP